MNIEKLVQCPTGDHFIDTYGVGYAKGGLLKLAFPPVASLADGVAVTSNQGKLHVAGNHRVRGFGASITGSTIIAAGTDPAADCFRALPVAPAPVATLVAVAGLITNGAHQYAVAFYDSVGDATISPLSNIVTTVTASAGQVTVSLPIGPTGTVGRKLYRTKAGAPTVLFLQSTTADNTTTSITDNLADASISGSIATANASGATILAAPVALSASARCLNDQEVAGVLAAGVPAAVSGPCMYSLRAITGATSGALANLQAWLYVELLPD